MKPSYKAGKLNRYTSLPVLLDLLKRRKFVLLDPSSWEDKNDTEILIEYKRRKGLDKVFALCFSEGDETIHHWKAFADGTSGCCIEIDKAQILETISSIPNVTAKPVTYKKLKDLKDHIISVDAIPFTKRWPYRCEEEFRIIWGGETNEKCFEIPIDLQMITKITINQRMPETIYQTIKDHQRVAFQNPEKRINRSTLYENQSWIKKFKDKDKKK